jgi:hypothetical protein
LGEDQIVLNSWAADDLGAAPGDTIRLSWFEPESIDGRVRERSKEFRLAAVAALTGAADDPALTPEVPGVTDQKSIANWDPPFPFDARRVRPKDEKYWREHRATPKAFISKAAGRIWESRFGRVTSLRIWKPGDPAPATWNEERIILKPAEMGLAFQPVKRQGLAASAGSQDFGLLFLYFSFFLIAAAVMLVVLLFRLGIDQRARELGILLAVGFRPGQVAKLLIGEGLAVAVLASLAGTLLGIGYAAAMLFGLRTWWQGAVGTALLWLDVQALSLAIGAGGGVLLALAGIGWGLRQAVKTSPRQLLAGDAGGRRKGEGGRRKGEMTNVETRMTKEAQMTKPECPAANASLFGHWSLFRHSGFVIRHFVSPFPLSLVLLLGAVGLGLFGTRLAEEARAGAFFGAGALTLSGLLMLVFSALRAGRTGAAIALGGGNLRRMALRNAARNPGRSTLTLGLVASACFLILSVSAFRLDPGGAGDRQSGTGGFAVVAQSDQPIFQDVNSRQGQSDLGFSPAESRQLEGATIYALRVSPGDDASCLNLYRPQRPRILGVPKKMINRGGFAFSAWAKGSGQRAASGGPGTEHAPPPTPWHLLEREPRVDADGVARVPVILDAATAEYSLHSGGIGATYDVADGRGGKLRLEVAGLLANSIFQGDLLVSETALLRYLPQTSGYRFFLVDSPAEKIDAVRGALERALGDYGLATETAAQRLAGFMAVENTYLSTFQSLGGLGLLLGTLGLAAVELRNVLERRGELALLRAIGFRGVALGWLVIEETLLLLLGGLGCGVLAAVVALAPFLAAQSAAVPWAWLAGTLAVVLGAGLAAGLWAVRGALAAPLLPALRGE